MRIQPRHYLAIALVSILAPPLTGCSKEKVPPSAVVKPRPVEEAQAAAGRIDAVMEELLAVQKKEDEKRGIQGVAGLGRTNDVTFLRRACVDLAGRLPEAEEIRAFVKDASPDKRQRWVDQLVLEPGAAEVRFRAMAEALRVTDVVAGQSQAPFIAWLREATADDMPYDEMVSTMIRAGGTVAENPAAGMMQRDEGDVLHTSMELAGAFLRADLRCTACHDHPFNSYTQRQGFEFAACFVRAGKGDKKPKTVNPNAMPVGKKARWVVTETGTPEGNVLRLPAAYMYRDGKPGDVVEPRYIPLGPPYHNDPRSAFEARPNRGPHLLDQVALWFTGEQNERFTKVGALRVWQSLFGRGTLAGRYYEGEAGQEPYHEIMKRQGCNMPPMGLVPSWDLASFDQGDAGSRAVQALGLEFRRCGSRMREFQRILARTEAYQREALAPPLGYANNYPLLAAPMLRRLPPEVTWDALARWLPQGGAAKQTSAELPQVPPVEHPLRLLGRATREWVDETVPVISHRLTRFMCNDALVREVAASDQLVRPAATQDGQVEQLFLDILGRFPADSEKSAALRHLAQHSESGAHDVAWALLNTSEFLFEP